MAEHRPGSRPEAYNKKEQPGETNPEANAEGGYSPQQEQSRGKVQGSPDQAVVEQGLGSEFSSEEASSPEVSEHTNVHADKEALRKIITDSSQGSRVRSANELENKINALLSPE